MKCQIAVLGRTSCGLKWLITASRSMGDIVALADGAAASTSRARMESVNRIAARHTASDDRAPDQGGNAPWPGARSQTLWQIILQARWRGATLQNMIYRYNRTIDLTPAGEFLPRPATLSWPARVGIVATLIAMAAGVAAVAAIFLWIASLLLPVALIAAAVAYMAYRLQRHRFGVG